MSMPNHALEKIVEYFGSNSEECKLVMTSLAKSIQYDTKNFPFYKSDLVINYDTGGIAINCRLREDYSTRRMRVYR